ncbi:MAG: transglutaminase-like cysteine peptidase [Geminicoccaceae bacterium]
MIVPVLRSGFLAALLAWIPAGVSAADFPPLFDTVEYRGSSLAALPQWQRVLGEIERETSLYRDCDDARNPCEPRALLAWQSMIKSQNGDEPVAQLRAVNRFVNRWQSRTDQDNYERADYWASPLTFLKRSGDCEDYAIMKYVSLRQLGFEVEQLRLVVVRDVLRDIAHAVLAVHVEEDVYILDNLFQAVLPQQMVSQYLPYYSVNEKARFSHLPPNGLLLASSPWAIVPSMAPLPAIDFF